jgi:hypothetical protein
MQRKHQEIEGLWSQIELQKATTEELFRELEVGEGLD